MNNKQIEETAVNEVITAINCNEALQQYIDSNDKTPIWDGDIHVHKSNAVNNSNFEGRIPTQIKGIKVECFSEKDLSFPIKVCDLESYLKDKGVIFFVVEVLNVFDSKLHYISLLPYDIKKLLEKSKKNQKTISVKLKGLDRKDYKQLSSICQEFLFNRELQYNVFKSIKDIREVKTINATLFPGSTPIEEYIFQAEIYLYGQENENSMPSAINKGTIESIIHTVFSDVKIGSKVYYNSYEVTGTKSNDIVKIGSSILMYTKEQKFKFDIKGNLKSRINDLRFLIDMFKEGEFYLGEEKITDVKMSKHKSDEMNDYYNYLKNIEKLLDILNIKDDLEMDRLNEEEYGSLDTLINVFIHKNKINLKKVNLGILNIGIANITVSLLIVRTRKGIEVEDFFNFKNDSLEIRLQTSDNNTVKCSIYIVMEAREIVKSSNLNLRVVRKSIKSFKPTKEYLEYVTSFVLELIKAYDMSGNIYKYLYTALNISKWIEQNNIDCYVAKVNTLQIIKRIRELNKSEIQEIMKIRDDSRGNLSMLCGIGILLEHKTDFEYYFEKLSEKEQGAFKVYPIYNLINDKKAYNQ